MMSALAADTAAGTAEAFYDAPEFWVLVAFVITVTAIIRPFLRFVTAALDKRSQSIAERIEEAQRLREEAQDLLASYQRKQRDAVKEAEDIVDHARRETERMGGRATADLEKAVERREQMALERIAQAEAKAVAEVRSEAIDIALEATRRLLDQNLADKKADALVNDAIKELPEKLH
jgi:F-type H+-transporting ATPase subunit b